MKSSPRFCVRHLARTVLPLLALSALCCSAPVVAAVPGGPTGNPTAVRKPGSSQRFVQVRLQFARVNTRDLAEKATILSPDPAFGESTNYPMSSNPEDARPFASGNAATVLPDTLKLGPPEAGASSSVVTQDAHPVAAFLRSGPHSIRALAGGEKKPGSENTTVTVLPRINTDDSITLRLTWSDAAAMPSRGHSHEVMATVQDGETIMLRASPVDAQTEMLLLATPMFFPARPSEGAGTESRNGRTKPQLHLSGELISRFHQDLGGELLPVGATAPTFTLPTPSGEKVSLDDALKGNKALILSFWFIGCPACREELPHLQNLYNQFHSRGLGVLDVDNHGDTPGALATFLHKNKLTFPVALDPDRVPDIYQDRKTWKHTVSGQYHAGGAPAIYIIGPGGKVMWREAGYDADTAKRIRSTLTALGLK